MAIFFLITSHKLELLSLFHLLSCSSGRIYRWNFGLFTLPHSKNLEVLVGCPWGCLYKLCPVETSESFSNTPLKVCTQLAAAPQKWALWWEKVYVLPHVSAGRSVALALSLLPGQPLPECEKRTSFFSRRSVGRTRSYSHRLPVIHHQLVDWQKQCLEKAHHRTWGEKDSKSPRFSHVALKSDERKTISLNPSSFSCSIFSLR